MRSLVTFLLMQAVFVMSIYVKGPDGSMLVRYSSCSIPPLQNGRARTRARGRMIRYTCNSGFELFGQQYSTCVSRNWEHPAPICIRSGCPSLPTLENGLQLNASSNAFIIFMCISGYRLVGSPSAYCDGVNWNSTLPSCTQDSAAFPKRSCDFESPDICGWTDDTHHDFNWQRQNKKTPSYHLRTGPSYDHTLGEGNEGYYMYIESSSRLDNDTARLISPVYSKAISQSSSCVVFYYHMYGRTAGTLRAIVHPISEDLYKIVTVPWMKELYTVFEVRGNQGNYWYKGMFDLEKMNSDFQIVFEGVRGPGYISDIAIDDVSIAEGEECTIIKAKDVPTMAPVTVQDSCLNRCDQKNLNNFTVTGEWIDCQCNENCDETSSCCVDVRDFCIFESESVSPDDDSTTMQTTEGQLAPSLPTSAGLHDVPTGGSAPAAPAKEATVPTTRTRPTTTTSPPTTTTQRTTPKTTSTTPRTTQTRRPTTTTAVPTPSTKPPPLPTLRFRTPPPPLKNSSELFGTTVRVFYFKKHGRRVTTSSPEEEAALTTNEISAVETVKKYMDMKTMDLKVPAKRSYSVGSVMLVVVLGVGAVAALLVMRRARLHKTLAQRLRARWRSEPSADMKFLVREEELEHDFAD